MSVDLLLSNPVSDERLVSKLISTVKQDSTVDLTSGAYTSQRWEIWAVKMFLKVSNENEKRRDKHQYHTIKCKQTDKIHMINFLLYENMIWVAGVTEWPLRIYFYILHSPMMLRDDQTD